MDKREYLRSLGFTVGERGRFSAEMQTALVNADLAFEKPKTGQRDDGLPIHEKEIIIPHLPPQKAVREPRVLRGISPEGYQVGFVLCFECHYHMMYCTCAGGVKAPTSVSASQDTLVRV